MLGFSTISILLSLRKRKDRVFLLFCLFVKKRAFYLYFLSDRKVFKKKLTDSPPLKGGDTMSRNEVGKVCILVLVSLLLFQTATPLYAQGDGTGGLQGSSVNQRTIEKTYDVKLITGDVVKVGLVNKTLQVLAIMPADPTELNKGFRVFRDEKGLYVIPSNVDLRKFDIELFNVEYLVEEGYWNQSEIPVIVQMKREGYPSVSSVIAERGGEIAPAYKLIPVSAAKIPVNKAKDVVKDLVSNRYVEKIWLDRKVHVHLNESVPLIGASSVWSLYNGSGVKIAILDTGIDKNHEDFFFPNGTSKVKVEVDFTDDNDTFDHFGHGTHVASIAAGTGAKSNGKFKGVAPGATLWNVKVLNRYGWGLESWVISGIEYAALGPDGKANTGDEADIISMSLGAPYWGDGTDPLSMACDNATDLGRIVVVAAGNDGPAYFTVGIPAASKKAITVGASTKQDEIAGFSSRGSTRDFRIKPDVVAPGYEIWAALARGSMIERWIIRYGWPPAIDVDGDGVYDYVRLSGTSMATPHVSGAAALIKQARGFDPNTVKNVLISTAKDLGYDVYTQGGGRINVPAAIKTKLIPDPATFSLGRVTGGVYNFNITFRNTGTGWINITLSPSLKEVFYGYDMTDKVSLNSTELDIPAGGQKAVNVKIDATSLPSGLYSGVVVTNYTVEGSDVHVIFGLSRMNVVHVRFLGLDGSPLSYAFVGAFKAYPSCEEMERGTAWWTWGITDENGTIDLALLSGTYYIIGADWYKQYYADAYAVSKTNVTGDMSVTLDLRSAHKLSYSPPGHVIASLSDGLFYFYVNTTCWQSIANGWVSWWYYPSVTDVYVTQTDLTLGLYYQHYDRNYINVVDPSTLTSPELYAIAFSRVNVTKDETLTYNEADLAKVIKEYRVALTPSIGAWMHRDYVLILTEQGPGWYWSYWFGMWGLWWKMSSPRQVTEYITPGMYWTGYGKRNDQPGVTTPFFGYWAEEKYPIPGTYLIASNAHPLHPALRLGVYGDYLDVGGLLESTYHNASKGEEYYKYEWLWSAPLNLVVKRNGTVIYNGSGWGWMWAFLNISPPAEIEIDIRGESLMSLSGYAHMNTKFNVSKGEGWFRWLGVTPYIEGLDMNNSHSPGNVTGHLISGPIYPYNVRSVEYSLDDGRTWSAVQTQLIRMDTLYGPILDYKFLLKNIPEGNYVSLRVNFADNKTVSSFTVLRGFYIRSALPSVPMAKIAGAYVDKGVIKMAVYAECTSPITQIQYSVDGNITGAVPVGNVKATTVEIAINGTSYSDGVHTIGVRALTSSGSGPWAYKRFYVRTLSNRYNLIAPFLPVPSSYRASDVARAIGPSVTLIAGWDTGKQRFFGYIPGVSKPEEDFPFSQGYGYFIHLTTPQRYVEVEG
jgi:subtilisin family serine protease